MALHGSNVLLALDGASVEHLTNAGQFAEALTQHIQHARSGLTSLLLQIGTRQQAYVLSDGCSGCARDHCLRGCRTQLLRRVLAIGLPDARLRVVPLGLASRPYMRHYLAWPTRRAHVLDVRLLQAWPEARLALQYRRGRRGIALGAALSVGDGPDARPRLRALGWQSIVLPGLGARLRESLVPLVRGPVPQDPMLVLPMAATSRAAHARLDELDAAMLEGMATAAATVVERVEGLGLRVECLDVEQDLRTTRLLAVTADGGDPGPQLAQELQVQDGQLLDARDPLMIALNPSQPLLPACRVPLLRVGDLPMGSSRWRPISSVHHLAIAGAVHSGVLAGMLAPLIATHPVVRIAVLDLADGAHARALAGVPGRVPTTLASDLADLVGAIGRLPDPRAYVLAVVIAQCADAALEAATTLLRTAMHRALSLLLVVPNLDTVPDTIRGRIPIVVVRDGQAQWHTRSGQWRWGSPTALRLPWRDASLAWRDAMGGQPAMEAPETAGFWALPADLDRSLEPPGAAVGPPDEPDPDVPRVSSPPNGSDAAAPLVIDDTLLRHVLRWAEANGGQMDGVSVRRLTAAFALPDKATAAALLVALRAKGLLTDEVRTGWYRVRSCADAERCGLLQPKDRQAVEGATTWTAGADGAVSDHRILARAVACADASATPPSDSDAFPASGDGRAGWIGAPDSISIPDE